MYKMMRNIIVFTAAMAICNSTFASDAAIPDDHVSLTISPLHLVTSIVEVNGEFKVDKNLGVALILGSGTFKTTTVGNSTIQGDTYSIREYGFQVNYYPNSNFSQGLQYGIEIMKIDLDLISSNNIKSSGSGVAFGPYLGYKTDLGIGLILVSQIGYQGYSVSAKAQDSNGNTASAAGGGGGLLLNLNLGFNF